MNEKGNTAANPSLDRDIPGAYTTGGILFVKGGLLHAQAQSKL